MGTNERDPSILERNLAMISVRSPRAAQRIRAARPHPGFVLIDTDEGAASATLDARALASKRRPMSEAEKFAGAYDPSEAAGVCVLGFGIGHHCGLLQERAGSKGVVLCFEPDVELLRAVLEQIDHTAWLKKGRLLLATDADDAAELSGLLQGFEAIISLGMQIIEHPASIARLSTQSKQFTTILTDVMRASRTQVVTTLAHAQVSFRNMLMNIDHYASCAGVDQLMNSCPGATAVVVAAGPSLKKNIEQLKDPEIRSRIVVIAAQTVLRPMLEQGIRPDFVTALDYHELSKRFYEGLTEEDVRGIRLVVEPKANPAILEAFPGEIVCIQEKLLDTVLGSEADGGLARPMGELPNGGTVAHLSYYLARALGCDPVVLIGQDLGFSDGQYYASGAAIHTVWGGELNAHNTLEMMEWQRIARMKSLLRPVEDIHGRKIYTDEQMATYLAQFESDFLEDSQRGLRIIDATEGGVRKRHTEIMTLAQALDGVRTNAEIKLPNTTPNARASIGLVSDRIARVIREAEMIRVQSDETIKALSKMLDAGDDQRKIGKLIDRVNTMRDRVMGAKSAYALVEFINQTGVLNRFRADRAIEIENTLGPVEKQRRQIERDIRNVEWVRDASAELVKQLETTSRVLVGEAPKITRDEAITEETSIANTNKRGRVEALIFAEADRNGLNLPRNLSLAIADGLNALQITVARLTRCQSIDGITLLSSDPERIRAILGAKLAQRVHIERIDSAAHRDRSRAIGIGRHQASDCWRGGMGMLTCYDEGFFPRDALRVMEQRSLDAIAIVGADWAMIDPELVDSIVDRHRSSPEQHRLAFSQAVPGIGAFVVDQSAVRSLSEGQSSARSFASIGGLIGYLPIAPQADPVAKTMCVQIDAAVRDAGVRAIADSDMRVQSLRKVYELIDEHPIDANSTRCLAEFAETSNKMDRIAPACVQLEICTGRLSNGPWARWKRGRAELCERPVLSIARAHSLLSEIIAQRPDATLVLDGAGDPLMHDDALGFVQLADELGFASVELRTDLLCQGVSAEQIIDSGLGILSVDVLANTEETYAALTGQRALGRVIERIESILETREDAIGGIPTPWILPRITRCDEVYEEIPDFYDQWLRACGCAVIDPRVRAVRGGRISALPIPRARRRQLEARVLRVRCDGMVTDRAGRVICEQSIFECGVERVFRQMHKHIEIKQSVIKSADEVAA